MRPQYLHVLRLQPRRIATLISTCADASTRGYCKPSVHLRGGFHQGALQLQYPLVLRLQPGRTATPRSTCAEASTRALCNPSIHLCGSFNQGALQLQYPPPCDSARCTSGHNMQTKNTCNQCSFRHVCVADGLHCKFHHMLSSG